VKHITVSLAVEGLLDEQVLRCLLMQSGKPLKAGACYGKQGRNHLLQNLYRFNQASIHTPFIVLADLDRDECAPALVKRWLPSGGHPNFILRIAVREIESWLMADAQAFAEFLGVPPSRIPLRPDEESDPKALVISLARRSRYREAREDIVPAPSSTSQVGKNYNGQLSKFVLQHWNVQRARKCSPSLDSALSAIKDFTPTTFN